ncbi:glutathione synthase [Panaeolus papilionaceus]|nr:glutathione synthase [Panaeolus papilionaceus]
MSKTFDFASWPPALPKDQLEALTLYASTYALSHGLLYLPPAAVQPKIPSAAIHAPISLFPSPFPRRLFEQANRIQKAYDILYARIAMDDAFLDQIMGAETGVGKVDDFIGQLWKGWKNLRDTGRLAQAFDQQSNFWILSFIVKPMHLGLFRSDYLLHATAGQPLGIKQVEFNTISVSFASLSQKTAALHRYLLNATGYYDSSPDLTAKNFPANDNIAGLVEGLARAHQEYGVPNSQILFVVQPGERNIFDQRPLEYELLEKHSIRIIRQTLGELITSASVDPNTQVLRIATPPGLAPGNSIEISTVYFRAGYMPNEYSSPEHYETRFRLESSKAIKCPTIALQLAGGKKIQEVLTQPGMLNRFLADEDKYGDAVLPTNEIDELRESFMAMWGLNVGEDLLTPDTGAREVGREEFGVRKARDAALSLVLKPQREGGGNNVYKEAIPEFLDTLPTEERQAWIAMELIQPPENAGNYLLRAGSIDSPSQSPVKTDVISELGIFSWCLFGHSNVENRTVGWLVRTKGRDSNEGGVATGFSVVDSLLLVD